MEYVVLGLAVIVGLANLGCFIMVLIKLFQDKGALHGILGIICSIYTFIWGWINAGRFSLQTIMIVWSVCIVLGIILNVAAQAMFQ